MIPALCPTCGKTTNCPDELAGRQIPCSGCGTNITVGAAGGMGLGGGPGLGAMGGYGGYSAPQPSASRSSGTPWFFQWWVLALGGVLAIGLVAGIVVLISPKPRPPAVAQEPTEPSRPAEDSKPAMESPADGGETTDKPTDEPAAPKGFAILPLPELALNAGTMTKVKLTIQRDGVEGSVPITIEALPSEVSAESVEIPEGEDSAEMQFTVAEEAQASSEPVKFKLIAEAGEKRAEREVPLVIKPRPLPAIQPLAALKLKPGATATLEVKVDRKGHMGQIPVAVEGLPAKVTVEKPVVNDDSGGEEASPEAGGEQTPLALVIPEEGSAIKLLLKVAADAKEGESSPRIVATVRGQKVESPFKLTIERFAVRVQPLPVITLKPGESKTIDVVVERRSYKGPVKLEPQNVPEKVSINALDIGETETNAQLTITAAEDAPEQVKSAALVTPAGGPGLKEALVIRVTSGEGSFLPAEVTVDSELARLLKRGSIGGRLESTSKKALMKIYGGTEESEAAVLKGLAWLARHQGEEGNWSFESYGKDVEGCTCRTEAEKEVKEYGVAATAFGLLPFLGAGVTHDHAPSEPEVLKEYRERVYKGLVWLGKQQVSDPDPKKDGAFPGGMYAHALATLAVCEAYGLSNDERIKVPAQRAIKYLVQSQHTEGGWRYSPRQPGDVSVVGWVFLAIRSGQLAGLIIDKGALDKAGKFLDSCGAGPEEAKLSRYSYLPGEPAKITTTAAGLLSRQYLGWKKDNPHLQAGCQYLMQTLPPENASALGSIYYYYYATQVLHHMEGENWDKWNHRIREHLIRTQAKSGHEEGSWSPVGTDHGAKAGRIYATSMALMTLESYYRHLPLYRQPVRVAGKSQ